MKTPVVQKNRSTLLAIVFCALAPTEGARAIDTREVNDPSDQPIGYLAPIELSSSDLSHGETKAYRTWFENGMFQGDLIEYTVSASGLLSTSVDLSGPSPINRKPHSNWSAATAFAVREAVDADWWKTTSSTSRKIFTNSRERQIAFRWESFSETQRRVIQASAADDTSSDTLDYIRGDRSKEIVRGGYLRTRMGVLGDIIHSNPVFVGAPKAPHAKSSYVAFANANAMREPRVYVGANDGLLHAFDASSNPTKGHEVWAYSPSQLWENYRHLSSPDYKHTYFVDGELSAADAEVRPDLWRTILVGSFGAGGKGLFGLDVTSPALSQESGTGQKYVSADRKLLWELDADGDDDLGHTFGRPIIAKFNDGLWYAAVGNGYNSVNGHAILYLINLSTGVITKVPTEASANNGLSGPALVDYNSDGKIDIAYAGDLNGNLWKFSLPGNEDGDALTNKTVTKLYNAGQAITSAPDVAMHPVSGHMVYLGTGRLLTLEDANDSTTVNAIYGIWDKAGTAGNGGLYKVAISENFDYGTIRIRTLIPPDAAIDWYGADANTGWKLTLAPGDRVISPVRVRASRLVTNIINPITKTNWLIEPNILDGGPSSGTVFDLNGDGYVNIEDRVDHNVDGDLADNSDIPMMLELSEGYISRITIARLPDNRDTVVYNALVLPDSTDVCSGSCADEGEIVDLESALYDDCKNIETGKNNAGVAGCRDEYSERKKDHELSENEKNKGKNSRDERKASGTGEGFDRLLPARLTNAELSPVAPASSGNYTPGRQAWIDLSED